MPTRRRARWIPAALLLTPVIELVAIVALGRTIGVLPTVLVLVASVVVGVLLVRTAGRRALEDVRAAAQDGRQPEATVADSALVFVGGLLMIPPGPVTSVAGLLLAVPPTRTLARRSLQARAVRSGSMYVRQQAAAATGQPHDPRIVRGEVVDE